MRFWERNSSPRGISKLDVVFDVRSGLITMARYGDIRTIVEVIGAEDLVGQMLKVCGEEVITGNDGVEVLRLILPDRSKSSYYWSVQARSFKGHSVVLEELVEITLTLPIKSLAVNWNGRATGSTSADQSPRKPS